MVEYYSPQSLWRQSRLHYTFRVDWISTEYSYRGEVPVEEVDLRQGRRHGILIMLGHRFGYDYATL
jgi:hypothetical protein